MLFITAALLTEVASGFHYERWGDAPVHSYGLAMSLRKDQALQFTDIGCVQLLVLCFRSINFCLQLPTPGVAL